MTYDNQVNQHKNLTSRSIYLLCDLHSSQNGAGIEFSDLCSSYQVTISHFTVFPNEPRFINEFVLANTQSGKFLDSITLIFVELSNIKLSEILNKKCRRFGAS
jgi:hypothetical protein